MNKFDELLPETTSYWKEDNIFYIKHESFKVSAEEAEAITELLTFAYEDTSTKALVINNREAQGVWVQEIKDIIDKVEFESEEDSPKKVITLTNSNVAAMEINRSTYKSKEEKIIKAFYCDMNEEVFDFINN